MTSSYMVPSARHERLALSQIRRLPPLSGPFHLSRRSSPEAFSDGIHKYRFGFFSEELFGDFPAADVETNATPREAGHITRPGVLVISHQAILTGMGFVLVPSDRRNAEAQNDGGAENEIR